MLSYGGKSQRRTWVSVHLPSCHPTESDPHEDLSAAHRWATSRWLEAILTLLALGHALGWGQDWQFSIESDLSFA